jgi:uncharacterized membrane protein YjgN (DUF898 family)
MSVSNTPASVPASDVSPHGGRISRFIGANSPYLRLLVRGNFLVWVTLGIYRFWFATEMRRFLWSHTQIGGESAEYTGRGIELFLGFLIAIAVLVPIYVVMVGVSLVLPGLESLGFLVLILLGQFAIYRARRYLLTRTVFRGVRLHQSGSALSYAFRAVGWWILIILTLGLAYPWAQANLERYKMRHTFFGDLAGRFDGSGTSLFLRAFLLWLIIVLPVVVALLSVSAADWASFAELAAQSTTQKTSVPLAGSVGRALVFGPVWIAVVGVLLFPAFEAVTMRWWLSGVRFGEIAATSSLRTSSVYLIYARCLGVSILCLIIAALFAMLFGVFFTAISAALKLAAMAKIVPITLGVIFYVTLAIVLTVIYQLVVKLALWRAMVGSLDISNFHLVDQVKAEGKQSSPFGEGLADALHVGSF